MKRLFTMAMAAMCSMSAMALEYPAGFDTEAVNHDWSWQGATEAPLGYMKNTLESVLCNDFDPTEAFHYCWGWTTDPGTRLATVIKTWNAEPSTPPKPTYVKIFHSEDDKMLYVLFKAEVGTATGTEKFEVSLSPYYELTAPVGKPLAAPGMRFTRFDVLGAGKWESYGTEETTIATRMLIGPETHIKNNAGADYLHFKAYGVECPLTKVRCNVDEAAGVIEVMFSFPFAVMNITDKEQTFDNGSKEFSMEVWEGLENGLSFEPNLKVFGYEQPQGSGHANSHMYAASANNTNIIGSNSWASWLKPVTKALAIEDAAAEGEMTITPSEIRFEEAVSATIVNAAGVTIAQYSDVTMINIESLPHGIYFVQSSVGNASFAK